MKPPPYKKYFTKAIHRRFPIDAADVVAQVDGQFAQIHPHVAFAATSINPMDKRLGFSAYFLALIQTLEGRGLGFDEIKDICLAITYDFVTPKNAVQAWFKKLPVKLLGSKIGKGLMQVFSRKISRLDNAEGFRATVAPVNNNEYILAMDIRECGICKLFAKYNAVKYATILCEVDKLTSNLAGLEMVRSSTIAYGADKCDFRWKKIKA